MKEYLSRTGPVSQLSSNREDPLVGGRSRQANNIDHTALYHFLSVLDEGSTATAFQSFRNVAVYGANGSPSAV